MEASVSASRSAPVEDLWSRIDGHLRARLRPDLYDRWFLPLRPVSLDSNTPGIRALLSLPPLVWGHCDTLEGPVVVDAKAALAKGDIAPVLKWIPAKEEAEVREAIAQGLDAVIVNPTLVFGPGDILPLSNVPR